MIARRGQAEHLLVPPIPSVIALEALVGVKGVGLRPPSRCDGFAVHHTLCIDGVWYDYS